jgi:uncharacterized membrane protein YoaK (UPF0700 family)
MTLPYLHAVLISIALLLFVCGASIARFAVGKRWRIRIHRAAGTAGLLSALLGVAAIVLMIEKTSGTHFSVPHTWIGSAAAAGAVFTLVLGHVLIRTRKNHQRIGTGHRWVGRLTLLLMVPALISGARLTGLL